MAAAAAAITERFVGNPGITSAGATSSKNSNQQNTTCPPPHHNHQHHQSHGLSCYSYEEVLAGAVGVEDHQQKVPIWVGLNCKLVSGISKSTTCQDLISSLLPSSQDPSKYVIVEKWKKMERILDPSVKILKVWKAWGDQIGDVSFVLRSSPTADGYIDKKTSRKVHRKRSSSYHHQKIACHEEECDKEGHRDAMEQLIKLVITQGEAIQAQLRKLRQQEEQIERYEEKMHKIRSSQLGENYVVDTYLKDEVKPRRVKRREKSPCKRDAHQQHHHHHHLYYHGSRPKREQLVDPGEPLENVGAEGEGKQCSTNEGSNAPNPEALTATANNDRADSDEEEAPECGEPVEVIREKTELMENIFQLNVRLTQEEERLVKLGLKIRKLSDKQRKAEWEELALQDLSQELEHLKQVTQDQSQEIEMNERDLTALEQLLDDKHDHLAFLTHEIQLMDEQSELLQRKVLELATASKNSPHISEAGVRGYDHPPHPPQTYQVECIPPSHNTPPMIANEVDFHNPVVTKVNSSLQSYRTPTTTSIQSSCTEPKQPSTASIVRFKSPQQQPSPQQQHESCSSSCSNSSSVSVQLNQKQCSGGANTMTGSSGVSSSDPQDNDSNSDTGISSLHSSVDENPMYVLDTLV